MSLSTLVEIYTLLCHEAEGELIYDSRNFICINTLHRYRSLRLPIYNSRNFICIYTADEQDRAPQGIYNSRNFICIYTHHRRLRRLAAIYNSRNFICIYTGIGNIPYWNTSTIVEILYVFTPICRISLVVSISTIVEILYVFTPMISLYTSGDESTIVEILYVFTPYACKITDYKRIIQTIVREISPYMAFPP